MKTGWYALLLTLVLLMVGTVFGVVLGGFISSFQTEGNRTPELNASLPTPPPTTTPATTPPTYIRTTTPPPATTLPPAVTATRPAVTLIAPANNGNQSRTVTFNFTAISNHATSMAFTLFLDDAANLSGTIANGTFYVAALAIPDGLHSWSVTTNDDLLNGASETRIFRVDGTAPVVTLVSPVNDSNLSTTNITFDFKATDNSLNTTLSFTFYLDDVASFWGTMPIGFDEFATITSMPVGLHSWSVDVSDASGNTGTSVIRFFRVQVDDTAPTVTLVAPANDSNFSNGTVAFNFTATDDNLNTILNFTFYLDGTANFTGTIVNNTFKASNITGIPAGLHSWSVNVSDAAGNTGMSATRFFRVNATAQQPVLYITSPSNTTYSTASILLSVSGNLPIDTWQYSLNGASNVSFTPNITFTAAEGANTITVTANGTSGNRKASTIYFTVDTVPPIVTILSPAANGIYNNSSVWLNFIVTLNEPGQTVLAQLDSAANYTLINASGNWNYPFNIANLIGAHSVQFFASDSVGNMNSTATVYFTVSP